MKKNCYLLFVMLCCVLLTKSQTVDFTYSTAGNLFCVPQVVAFSQNCTGTPINFIWNFGNGQEGSSASQSVNYGTPGTYTVTLTAVYQNDAISVSKTIVINPTPVISLTADKNSLCQPGTVTFTAPGSAFINSWEWNFGDGSPVQTTNSNNIAYSYTSYNNFTATVKGTTANGCTAIASYNVAVAKFPINGSVTPASGCIPVVSNLATVSTLPPGDAVQGFVWDFGDGSPITAGAIGNINHLYNTTATINTASVIITSVQGCTNQYTFSPFAFGTPPFGTDAHTTALRDTFCGSEAIQFYGKAVNANQYTWDFGDASIATITDTLITHKYAAPGNKLVILTPLFNGCPGTRDSIPVFIEGVVANYVFSNSCGNKNSYNFTNLSLGNISHFEWSYSDVPLFKDSTNFNPTHSFPLNGSFTTNLLLVDSTTGCRDSLQNAIYTARPLFSSSSNSVCKDSLVSYHISNTYPPGSGYVYDFHVNGVVVSAGTDSNLVYHPLYHGSYNDFVVIRDVVAGTCDDSIYLPAVMQVKGPVAAFTAPSGLCADKTITITNTTSPFFPADSVVSWRWDFGDGKKDSVQNPVPHLYAGAGNFPVVLTATDNNGCGQQFTQYVQINPLPRVSAFPALDTICFRDTAILRGYTIDTLLWIPSTNINCTNCDTVKVYPAATTSYIAQATNSFGCKSYDTCVVKVYGPINLRVFPSDTSVCPKKPVQYNLNANGITLWSPATYLSNAGIKNPVAAPDTSVTYTIIVKDSVGCYADTTFANIHTFPLPTVNAGPDRVLPYNSSFTLSPAYSAGTVAYLWTPPGTLNCVNCAAPDGTALVSQTYKVEITDINGCKSSDDAGIFVSCEKSNLLLPTAFTPNNNGVNDYFYPITRGYRIIKEFIVFDRLGGKVFERKDFLPNIASLGWDGRIKGNNNISTESFVWYVKAECELGQTIERKGSVILVK